MGLRYDFKEARGNLIATVAGHWELEAVSELIDAIVEECTRRNCDRVLADCMEIQIAGRVLEFERFVLGQRIGEKFRNIRFAALFPADQINKFAESIAVGAGAQFLVTHDREEALRWLGERAVDGAGG
jgi:hypothetical protein